MRHLSCDDSGFTDGHYLPGLQSSEPRYAALNVKLPAGPRVTGAQKTRDSFYLKSRKAAQRRGYLGLERDERVRAPIITQVTHPHPLCQVLR